MKIEAFENAGPPITSMRDIGALHALAAFNLPAALVSEDMRAIETVSEFPGMFDDVFRFARGRIVFRAQATATRFANVMHRAASEAENGTLGWVSEVFSQPTTAPLPLLIRILAEPRARYRAALIVVVDLNLTRLVSNSLLRTTFGLTGAEAALAAGLMQGDTLKEVCDKAHIRMSTARTQLAGVLAKTGTSRQSDLIRLLAKLSIPSSGHRMEA